MIAGRIVTWGDTVSAWLYVGGCAVILVTTAVVLWNRLTRCCHECDSTPVHKVPREEER